MSPGEPTETDAVVELRERRDARAEDLCASSELERGNRREIVRALREERARIDRTD